MKILLTGHRGFIGSNMLRALENHDVKTFEWGDQLPDVSDRDWVIHIGAISSTVETDVEKVLKQNTDFSIWLLQQAIKHRVNFQYSSSASVYGSHGGVNQPFKEEDPVDPRSPYAWSKYLFERHVSRTKNTNNIIIQGFRYFNVYGPGEDHKGNQASPQHKFRKQFSELGHIKLFEGSENFYRDFIHVNNIVNCHLAFMNIPESGLWNVGTGITKSFLEVAREITTEHRYIKMPENATRSYQSYTCADTTKLINTLEKYEKNTGNGSSWIR